MANVYLSLGSNIARETNICSCMRQLRQDFGQVGFSGIYETPAEGFAGEPFLNLVATFTTSLSVTALKDYLRKLEDAHGRVRDQEKFSARTLDADLILYDGLNLQPTQNIPHSDILKYPFVLFPLADIAPDHIHPVSGKSISAIAAESTLSRESLKPVELTCL